MSTHIRFEGTIIFASRMVGATKKRLELIGRDEDAASLGF
jgi:hypothetical protein